MMIWIGISETSPHSQIRHHDGEPVFCYLVPLDGCCRTEEWKTVSYCWPPSVEWIRNPRDTPHPVPVLPSTFCSRQHRQDGLRLLEWLPKCPTTPRRSTPRYFHKVVPQGYAATSDGYTRRFAPEEGPMHWWRQNPEQAFFHAVEWRDICSEWHHPNPEPRKIHIYSRHLGQCATEPEISWSNLRLQNSKKRSWQCRVTTQPQRKDSALQVLHATSRAWRKKLPMHGFCRVLGYPLKLQVPPSPFVPPYSTLKNLGPSFLKSPPSKLIPQTCFLLKMVIFSQQIKQVKQLRMSPWNVYLQP